MTNRSKILAVSLASLALAACATTGQQSSTYVEPQPATPTAGVSIQPDGEYISRVELMARRQGADVRWINVPTKRIVASQ